MMKLAFSCGHGISVQGWGNALTHPLGLGCLMGLTVLLKLGSARPWEAPPLSKGEGSPLAPDFVVELRSPTEQLEILQKKMQEYRQNGVRLGWLINAETLWSLQIEIYRAAGKEVLQSPVSLSGEDVLPGFVLDLSRSI